jgi:hypothetical protein
MSSFSFLSFINNHLVKYYTKFIAKIKLFLKKSPLHGVLYRRARGPRRSGLRAQAS